LYQLQGLLTLLWKMTRWTWESRGEWVWTCDMCIFSCDIPAWRDWVKSHKTSVRIISPNFLTRYFPNTSQLCCRWGSLSSNIQHRKYFSWINKIKSMISSFHGDGVQWSLLTLTTVPLMAHAGTAESMLYGYKYNVCSCHSSSGVDLMMETETFSKILDTNSIFTWLITQEDFITKSKT
jgi:hypothetical protein